VQGAVEDDHVLVEDLGPAAVVAFGRGGALAFEGFLPDVVTVQLGGDGQDGELLGPRNGPQGPFEMFDFSI
jgi:hypothetical protein